MTIQPNSNLTERLLRYSASASLVISSGILISQPVMATEIIIDDGDVLIGVGDDPFEIDLNNDGAGDFSLLVNSARISFVSDSLRYVRRDATVKMMNFLDADDVLGVNTGYRSAYALVNNSFIGQGASGWHPGTNMNSAILTLYSYYYMGRDGFASTRVLRSRGLWHDLSSPHFLGIKIMDAESVIHYGWVELSCTDSQHGGPQLIVHRHAYNNTPSEGITTPASPSAVDLTSASANRGEFSLTAMVFAALGGMLTWLRRKIRRSY